MLCICLQAFETVLVLLFDVQCILLRKAKILLIQQCLCFIIFTFPFVLFRPLYEKGVMSEKSNALFG